MQWPSPPVDPYPRQPPATEVTTAQILALIAERDRQYGQRFDAQEKAMILALASAEKAVTKAEGAAEKRFEAMNEFRSQLREQAASFMTRVESNAKFVEIERRLSVVEENITKKIGEAQGFQSLWGWIVGAGGFLLAGLALFLRTREKVAA